MQKITFNEQFKMSTIIGLESLIGILMTTTDTLVVARLGNEAICAVGAMAVILNTLFVITQTINVSNNAVIANMIGANDVEGVKKTTGNAIIMACLFTFICMLFIVLISPIFPSLFKVSQEALTYLYVRLFGFLPLVIVEILSGHIRTQGKANLIFRLRIIAMISNAILDMLFVFIGYGIAGVAFVTILIDIVLMSYLLYKVKDSVVYRYHKGSFQNLLKLAKWNFMERIVTKADQFIFNLLVARLGNLEYAVHIILMQAINICSDFITGFQNGVTINIGKAIGSKQHSQIENIVTICKKIMNYFTVYFPIIILFISYIIMVLSFSDMTSKILFMTLLPFIMVYLLLTIRSILYFSYLRGVKDFSFLAIRNMVCSIFRIVCACLLVYVIGIYGVWTAFIIYAFLQYYLSRKQYIKKRTL